MAEDPTAFPTLDESELDFLDSIGSRRKVELGDILYREGDASYDFYVIRSGEAEISVKDGTHETVIARHGPGRFLGELNLLTGMRVYVSARIVEPGEVVVVPATALRQVIATRPGLGDRILAALIARRSILISGAAAAIKVVGSRFSLESLGLREFLTRSRIPHEWLDADQDPAVDQLLADAAVGVADLPVVITAGKVMRKVSTGELASYLGLTVDSLPGRCFDLVVVGAGPAGLAAALYGASEGLKTLGVETAVLGGQAGASSRIENYLGFPMGISGADLSARAFVQAEKFGAQLTAPCAASSLREEAGHLIVTLVDKSEVAGRAVIVATGARYRRLAAEGIEKFEGRGVYYAATEMEARLCGGLPVVVAGGGNSAGQAGLYLAERAENVTFVIRGDDLNKSMSRYLVDRIEGHDRITIRTNSQITGLKGDGNLSTVRITEGEKEETLRCEALFSFIGADPASGWISGCAALDRNGFVLTDRALKEEELGERWVELERDPLPFETSFPGMFAVGDVRSGSMKRVAAAVGEGSAAVHSVHEFLAFTN